MTQWLRDAGQDLRFATRAFRKRPGFAAIAVLTLALGIGAATAVFSIVDAVLLRPLPYRNPDRLVAIWDRGVHDRNLSKIFASYADYDQLQRHASSFEGVSAATWARQPEPVLTGRGPAQQVLAIPASATFFETLGVQAEFGRTFSSADEQNGCAVVLAHDFWKTKLGGDPNVVGQSLTLDQRSCAVLGVMTADFSFYPHQASMWRLLDPGFKPSRDKLIVGIFARLKPGVGIAAGADGGRGAPSRAASERRAGARYRARSERASRRIHVSCRTNAALDAHVGLRSRRIRTVDRLSERRQFVDGKTCGASARACGTCGAGIGSGAA